MAKRVKFFALLNSDNYKPKKQSSLTQPLLTSSVSSNDLLSDAQKARVRQIIRGLEGKESHRDKVIRQRNSWMLANTVISLVLMMIMLQLEWNGHETVETKVTYGIKVAIFCLTLIQILQICEVYWQEVSILRERSKEESTVKRTRAFLKNPQDPNFSRIEKKQGRSTYSTVFKTTPIIRQFLLELVVTMLCPAPFFGVSLSKEGGLLMFLRLYIVGKVIRDHSAIYNKRKVIERIPGYSPATHPTFNTFLSLKMFYHQYPLQLISCIMLCFWFIFSYCIYILEREAQPEVWNFWLSLYIGVNCLITGWGDDTFGIYSPITWTSKILCLLAVVVGVFWFAALIDQIHSRMQPTSFQLTALEWLARSQCLEKERDTAARLIQTLWRYQRWKKQAKLDQVSKVTRNVKREEFRVKYLQLTKTLSKLRRQRQTDSVSSSAATKSAPSTPTVPHREKDNSRLIAEQTAREVSKALRKEFASMMEDYKKQILAELKGEPPVVKIEKEEEDDL